MTNNKVSFEDICNYVREYNNHYVIKLQDANDRDYGVVKGEAVVLSFTTHGSYCGSAVEKSNFRSLKRDLIELAENESLETNVTGLPIGIEILAWSFSTQELAIKSDLDEYVFDFIKDVCDNISGYPLYDDEDYSVSEYGDLYETWLSYAHQDFMRELTEYTAKRLEGVYEEGKKSGKYSCDFKEFTFDIAMYAVNELDIAEISEVNCDRYISFNSTTDYLKLINEFLA